MGDPYIGEIRVFGCNYAPYGWAQCNGQILPIAQYTALFAVIGKVFGGDGQTNFALPNLQGRAPIHQGSGAGLTPRQMGQTVGQTNVTLQATNVPQHTHNLNASTNDGSGVDPTGSLPGAVRSGAYGTTTTPVAMAQTVNSAPAATTAHNNMQPYQVLNYCIATQGIFPPRS